MIIEDTNQMLYIGDKPIGYASNVVIKRTRGINYRIESQDPQYSFSVEVRPDLNSFRRKILGIKRDINVNRYIHLAAKATSKRKMKKYAGILGYKITGI
jgi:hypothetical protein